MKATHSLVSSQGLFRVHTAYYASPAPQGTIILVNGSLATTASFAQTVRYLQPCFNVVCFDEPYAGQSKPHNDHSQPVTKEQEARILLDLIDHFEADHLLSFSWGGASTLLALAQRPRAIRKAVIMAFSPVINPAMRDYLETGVQRLIACDRTGVADLINETIGQHLPSLYKRYNFRHISSLDDHEYLQMAFHVNQVLKQDTSCYMSNAERIDVPVLFINGDKDIYTTPDDAHGFGRYIERSRFATVRGAGHFLDLESKATWQQSRDEIMSFLRLAPTRSSQPRFSLLSGDEPLFDIGRAGAPG